MDGLFGRATEPKRSARRPDPLFDRIRQLWNLPDETPAQCRIIQKFTRELRALGADAATLQMVYDNWRWKPVEKFCPTPQAMVKHFVIELGRLRRERNRGNNLLDAIRRRGAAVFSAAYDRLASKQGWRWSDMQPQDWPEPVLWAVWEEIQRQERGA